MLTLTYAAVVLAIVSGIYEKKLSTAVVREPGAECSDADVVQQQDLNPTPCTEVCLWVCVVVNPVPCTQLRVCACMYGCGGELDNAWGEWDACTFNAAQDVGVQRSRAGGLVPDTPLCRVDGGPVCAACLLWR